jgi:outer membrane lipoprotein-sorting protein
MPRPSLLPRVLTLLLALLPVGTAGAPAPDLFDEIYARSRATEKSLKTLTGRFTETTTTAMLTTPLVSRGVLAVVRPDRIVLRYAEPEPHVVLIDGDRMTFAWPSRAITQGSDIGAARKRIDKYFLDKSPDELRRSFKIAAAPSNEPRNTWHISMQPTRSQISQGLSRLHLWIDRTSLLLSAMQLDFPNGDTKLMVFEGIQVNVPVEPSVFSSRP